MALNVRCPKGHSYVQSDIYPDWPDDEPVCPECHKQWEADRLTAPLREVEARYNDLLKRLGVTNHDGAVAEIEALRRFWIRHSAVEGEWYWVRENGGKWFIAERNSGAAGGWTNGDTWEDFDGEVVEWIRIDRPGESRRVTR